MIINTHGETFKCVANTDGTLAIGYAVRADRVTEHDGLCTAETTWGERHAIAIIMQLANAIGYACELKRPGDIRGPIRSAPERVSPAGSFRAQADELIDARATPGARTIAAGVTRTFVPADTQCDECGAMREAWRGEARDRKIVATWDAHCPPHKRPACPTPKSCARAGHCLRQLGETALGLSPEARAELAAIVARDPSITPTKYEREACHPLTCARECLGVGYCMNMAERNPFAPEDV